MYRKLTVLLAMLFSISLASSPLASAQAAPDIDAIGESVLATDPEALVEAFETTDIDPTLLPEAIIAPDTAEDGLEGTPEAPMMSEGGLLGAEPLEGAIGSHGTGFEVDTAIIPGLMNEAALDFIVFDEAELETDVLGDFKEGAEAGGTDVDEMGMITEVEDVVIGDGYDAVLLSVTADDESVTVQMIAIPVGNVFVIGTVVAADLEPVDSALVYDVTEELVLGAAEHVGDVADSAGQ